MSKTSIWANQIEKATTSYRSKNVYVQGPETEGHLSGVMTGRAAKWKPVEEPLDHLECGLAAQDMTQPWALTAPGLVDNLLCKHLESEHQRAVWLTDKETDY